MYYFQLLYSTTGGPMATKVIPPMDCIIYDDNPLLKAKSEDVLFPLTEIQKKTIGKMVAYVAASYESKEAKYDISPGIGMAAIQLGLPKKNNLYSF